MNNRLALKILASLVMSVFLCCCNRPEEGLNGLPIIDTPLPDSRSQQEKQWESIFFREINRRVESAHIGRLRDKQLGSDSREVRVWVGFGLHSFKGLILTKVRSDQQWTAQYLPAEKTDNATKMQPLGNPKSGWESLRNNLERLGIFTLPDSSDIDAVNAYPDGEGAVVEIRTFDSYRTYMYGGLANAQREESKKMLAICNTLSKEFGVELLNRK